MEELIKMEFPVNSRSAEKSFNSLSSIEENALHYTAGYVIPSLVKDMTQSNYTQAQRDEFLLCLQEMTERTVIIILVIIVDDEPELLSRGGLI